jgi:toxin HigB-1
MIVRFNNDYLEALFQDIDIPGKPVFNVEVVKKFKKTILLLSLVDNVAVLRQFNGLNFELLKGDYSGFCSVRVDKKYRLILSFEGEEVLKAEALIVEDLTNHYK